MSYQFAVQSLFVKVGALASGVFVPVRRAGLLVVDPILIFTLALQILILSRSLGKWHLLLLDASLENAHFATDGHFDFLDCFFWSVMLLVAPLQVHTISSRAFATVDMDREERVAGRGATRGGTSSNKSTHA